MLHDEIIAMIEIVLKENKISGSSLLMGYSKNGQYNRTFIGDRKREDWEKDIH